MSVKHSIRALGAAVVLALSLAACGGSYTVTNQVHVTPPVAPERPAMPLQYAGQKCAVSLLSVCHGGRYRDPTLFKVPVGKKLLTPSGKVVTPPRAALRAVGGTVLGYDTVSLQYVPANAAAVAGYADGYANCAQVHSMFPHAHDYCYAIHSWDRADCLDMEPGAAAPSQEVAWLRNELAHRSEWSSRLRAPCLYTMESWMGSLFAYANAAGLHYGTDYTVVTAAWNNSATVPPFRDGHQYASNCCLDWDVWNASFFQKVAPPKPPKPPPENYLWFSHARPASGLIAGPWPVAIFPADKGEKGKDFNNERSVIRLYDTARRKAQSGERLKYQLELRDEAHGLAIRLAHDSHKRSAKANDKLHAWGRVDCLLDRSMGNRVRSWNACLAWGRTHSTARYLATSRSKKR